MIYFCLAAGLLLWPGGIRGAEGQFLGANSCASSSCHGGGGPDRDQFLVWSLKDAHSQRPAARLATARARQIANAAGIADPAADERCTVCHAPLRDVPAGLRGANFQAAEGVSCESCHGPAGNWLRSHTRPDYSRADRTAAGMRDLENLYVRANTCVACHQVIAQPLLDAGHPELIFELDGQDAAEPRHWSAAKNGPGAQAWFVGQAVALREMSWELALEKAPAENEINRWRGLVWLMVRAGKVDPQWPAPPDITFRPNAENFGLVQKWSDGLARSAAELSWTGERTEAVLVALAGTSPDFREAVPRAVQARRAERLVLALDRLLAARKGNPEADAALDHLFSLAQSLPDFDPNSFAAALTTFAHAVTDANRPSTK